MLFMFFKAVYCTNILGKIVWNKGHSVPLLGREAKPERPMENGFLTIL